MRTLNINKLNTSCPTELPHVQIYILLDLYKIFVYTTQTLLSVPSAVFMQSFIKIRPLVPEEKGNIQTYMIISVWWTCESFSIWFQCLQSTCACELMCPLLKLNTLVIKMHMTVKAGMVLQVVATDHCCHLNWFFSSSDTAYQEDLQLTQDPLERFSLSAELETQVSATKRLEVVFCLFFKIYPLRNTTVCRIQCSDQCCWSYPFKWIESGAWGRLNAYCWVLATMYACLSALSPFNPTACW